MVLSTGKVHELYWLTHSLPPIFIIDLFEKLIVAQMVEKVSDFYGARRLSTIRTVAWHLTLQWFTSVHSLSLTRSILKLSSRPCLGLSSCLFLRDLNITILGEEYEVWSQSLYKHLQTSVTSSYFSPYIRLVILHSDALIYGIYLGSEATLHTHTKQEIKLVFHTRMYPKVAGLAAWSENCKWYSCLPLCAVVSLFCDSM
jgi:hypothetical protein